MEKSSANDSLNDSNNNDIQKEQKLIAKREFLSDDPDSLAAICVFATIEPGYKGDSQWLNSEFSISDGYANAVSLSFDAVIVNGKLNRKTKVKEFAAKLRRIENAARALRKVLEPLAP